MTSVLCLFALENFPRLARELFDVVLVVLPRVPFLQLSPVPSLCRPAWTHASAVPAHCHAVCLPLRISLSQHFPELTDTF